MRDLSAGREITQPHSVAAQEALEALVAVSLVARGLSQANVAAELRAIGMAYVDRATVSRWVVQMSAGREMHKEPSVAVKEALEALAAKIEAEAETEARPARTYRKG